MPDGSKFPVPQGFRTVSSEEVRAGEGVPVRVLHPDPGLRIVVAPEQPVPAAWYQLELQFPPEGLIDVQARFEFANARVLWQRLALIERNHFVTHLRFEAELKQLTLIVNGSGRLAEPSLCRLRRVSWTSQLKAMVRRGRDIVRRDGFGVLFSALNYFWRLARPVSIPISRGSAARAGEAPYDTWTRIFDEMPERDRAHHEARLTSLSHRPLISILTDLSAVNSLMLDRLARSASEQVYPSWELIVSAPEQLHHDIRAGLAARSIDAGKLRIARAGANPAESMNAALAAAEGEYILQLAQGAQLRAHALLDLAMTAGRTPSAELIYGDEDQVDAKGQRNGWRFKPAWSPDLLESIDYIGQSALMRRETVRALGGWRAEADPSHDLLLRFSKAIDEKSIVHLAKVLVHRSTDEKTPVRPERSKRQSATSPRVSLIIPTRDNADVLETCVRSIRQRTRYGNYEILIVDNGSVEEKTNRLFAELSNDPAVRIMPCRDPFNFSKLNNFGARAATGSILGLINNDIEATHEDWLDEMVALATRPEIGCVGAKLIYPDGRIQHAGVVLGVYGVAGHAHRFARNDDSGYLSRLRTVQNVSAVTAACLLIRKEVFEEVGGLDESLAVAFNDVDFCLKLRAAGYRNVWTPFAELIHHESLSRGRDFTPAKAQRFAGEYATMQQRWGQQLLNDPYYSPHLTYDAEDFSLRLR